MLRERRAGIIAGFGRQCGDLGCAGGIDPWPCIAGEERGRLCQEERFRQFMFGVG